MEHAPGGGREGLRDRVGVVGDRSDSRPGRLVGLQRRDVPEEVLPGRFRFSEDLDFTRLLDGGGAEVLPVLKRMLRRVSDESGVDFQGTEPQFEMRDNGTSAEGRIYYRGPRNALPVRIKLDVTAADAERVVCLGFGSSWTLPSPMPGGWCAVLERLSLVHYGIIL